MAVSDRDYTKEKIREVDDRGGRDPGNNWLLYLAILIALGFLIYLFAF